MSKELDITEKTQDSLLACLSYMTGYFGESKSKASLAESLPETSSNDITPDMFCRAAGKVGLQSEIISKSLNKLDEALCPVVAILENGNACIILGFNKSKKILSVVFPANDSGINVIEIGSAELKKQHKGQFILIKQAHLTEKALKHDDDNIARFSGHWFWQVIWENKFIYLRVVIAAIFINLFVLTSPLFIMNVYDRVLPSNALDTGWALALGAFGVFIFDFILKILRGYFVDVAGRRGDVIWTRRLYDQVLDMRADARSEPVGAFASHMREFEHIREFFTSATLAAIVDFPFAMLFIVVVWALGGIVAFVPLGLFILVFLIGMVLQIPVKGLVRKSFKSNEEKQAILVESLNGLETIKGCGATRHFRGSYGRYTAENALWGQKSRWWSSLSVHIATFAQQISAVGIVLLGMYLIKDGEMSVGALIACVILSGRAIAPVTQIAGLINKYHQATSALKTLNRVMKMPTERPKDNNFLYRPKLNGIFGVEKLGFTYTEAKVPALQNINFAIQAGERVGIVGRIGSGKSTLIKLMMKFYQPTTGVIRLDGTDMNQIDPIDLRRDLSYIGQDTTLFRGTVRENIAMGNQNSHQGVSDEDILRAAQLSGAHGFIRLHPLGYNAPVGENGAGFSGGQKQAIAIARALVGKPSTLICDEPTNEMDNTSEALLINALKPWLNEANRGLIVVTHRFSLLDLVDRLILMEQGQIIADGPKDEVLKALNSGDMQVKSNSSGSKNTKKIDIDNDKKE